MTSVGEVKYLTKHIEENGNCSCQTPIKRCGYWQNVREGILLKRTVDIFARPRDFPVSLEVQRDKINGWLVHYQRLLLALLGKQMLTHLEPSLTKNRILARDIAQNLFDLYDVVRKVTGVQAVIDSSKSPTTMKWLWMQKPADFKAIYLVRDGRGVMASNLRKKRSAAQSTRNWVRTNVLAQLLVKNLPKQTWKLVRYEELCQEPPRLLKELCQFLGFPYDEDMLSFRSKKAHTVGGNRMRFSHVTEIVNRETWRETLTSYELQTFEKIAGKLNRKLGYQQ